MITLTKEQLDNLKKDGIITIEYDGVLMRICRCESTTDFDENLFMIANKPHHKKETKNHLQNYDRTLCGKQIDSEWKLKTVTEWDNQCGQCQKILKERKR